jgi:ABC-type transport system substrate-binding protein/DNA-binding SARP family transcriptional activator
LGARLHFGILGPLEVRHEGAPVRVGGPRQRALLSLLLCNANRVVSRDRLVDDLLGDQPANSAERLLRVHVSRVRKALAVDGDEPRVIVRPPGYLLRVEQGELDLYEFQRLLRDGQQALEHGDPANAAMILREAESLWRGRPLADLEFEPFARLEVERLEQLRLLAVEERVEADLALGRHTAACPELEVLVEEHPLRERLRGQLMLALYRSGRQADALEVYRAGRAQLVDQLGLEPGPQLRQLERAILEQDGALELARSPLRQPAAVAVAAPAEEPAVRPPGLAAAPPRGRLRHRAGWAAIAVAIGAALVASVIALDLGSSTRRQLPLEGNVLALISPKRGDVSATVPLAAPPTNVAAGFGSMWVSEAGAGVVVRVDPNRRAVIATIPLGGSPSRIVAAGGSVWVLDPHDRTISAIDPRTDSIAQTIAAGSDPADLAYSTGSLWVADPGDGTVLRLDPNTGSTQHVISTGGDPSGLAAAGDTIWVADDESGIVDRIDARTGAITDTIHVGDAPAAVAATPAAAWVLDPLDATLSRIDPTRNAVVSTVSIGGAPTDLAVSGGSVWITDTQPATVVRLDTQRDDVTSTTATADLPLAVASDNGLWVVAQANGANHRGGTLTTATSYQIVDTVDPAASTSNNVSPPQLLGLTNDGLVTIDHVPGPSGTRLVPDLATSLPVPSNAGRTYTFRLRPGIRYSTGATVKPSDVTHSFERLFAIGSSGTSWYQSITGADACLRRPAGCDLARGIAANNRTDTVTFHLTQPDPDFVFKLTLPFAYVLPGSTADRLASSPLPATGPYQISRYVPGQEVVLNRNPRFREWSAAAQPAGYPNQLLLRLNESSAVGAASVAASTADFMANLGEPPGRAGAYFLKQHRQQVRVNPPMGTNFLFLNVRARPFTDIRVRRALNFALDRRRIVNSYGGPMAARATCQILPEGIPGYSPYCPFTTGANAAGRWRGPDMAEARRLVAASGTEGMRVTVWNNTGPPQVETRATVAALNQLGYRASLRLLPDNTYFTYVNDSRNRAQVIDGGWGADYAAADDFIGKLTCRYFVPGDGQDTTNASEFCDAAFDRQVAHAASLQTTDPARADAIWVRLDRELTNLAIWLPTATPNEVDLLSRRVGNYQYNPIWGVLLDQLWVR